MQYKPYGFKEFTLTITKRNKKKKKKSEKGNKKYLTTLSVC